MEAEMSMQAKKELIHRMRWQYAEANRKEKTEIIDGIIAATGYHRKYVTAVLRKPIKPLLVLRNPQKVYDENVKKLLIVIWTAANQICSKRLAPFLPEFVETLERFGHLNVSSDVKAKVITLSPATIDRLLKDERSKHPRGKTTTRPGNLLKQRIKIRTFAEWDEVGPGFFEGDLVAHCGDHVDGSFLNTLVLTDIASCWTEFVPLMRKCDADVTAAINAIRAVLPIVLLGVDTDNGSEFINEELFNYCEREKITFTRSRPYKKNDQAHVEQKNGSVIRRTVGYDRFEGVESWHCLMNLYRVLRLYVNFFQPSCKLLKKVRTGSRVSKKYDKARTPYQRLLESALVSPENKRKLTELYNCLDPVVLFDQIGSLQQKLLATAMDCMEAERCSGNEPLLHKTEDEPLPTAHLSSLKPIRTLKRGYRKRAPHNWRTRKDPLEGAYDVAREVFLDDNSITGAELLNRLQERFPDKFNGPELKTVQRRLAVWRRQQLSEQFEALPPLDMEQRVAVRELHDMEGKSVRAIAEEFAISRNTAAKYVRNPEASRYTLSKPRLKPLTDRWRAKVEEILEGENEAPRKQHQTARQIHDRLVTEQGYTGSERTIRQLMADIRHRTCSEASIPRGTAYDSLACRQVLANSNPLAPTAIASMRPAVR